MGYESSWRRLFAPKIAAIIKQFPHDCQERKLALREIWPKDEERKYWPYKVYLDEIARQTGRKPPLGVKLSKPVPGQLELPMGEKR